MVESGISDILLTYNIIGQLKLDHLVALAHRADLKVVADSAEVVEGLSAAMSRAGLTLPVLVECDTGAHRCAVATPAEAAALAQMIDRANGLAFRGLVTYPPKAPWPRPMHGWLRPWIYARAPVLQSRSSAMAERLISTAPMR